MAHAFNSSILKAETDRQLQVQGQPNLHRKFQTSQNWSSQKKKKSDVVSWGKSRASIYMYKVSKIIQYYIKEWTVLVPGEILLAGRAHKTAHTEHTHRKLLTRSTHA